MTLDELKFYVMVTSIGSVLFTMLAMGRYVRQSSRQGLVGDFGWQQIPPTMRWMPVVAALCGLYILLYTGLFLLQPDIQYAYLPIVALQDYRIALLGIFLMPLGALIMIISQWQLGSAYRLNLPQQKTRLVRNGLYRWSRNPLYMGLYIMLLAIFLMIPNWPYLICLVFFVINYHYKITLLEEPYLHQMFAEEYGDYTQRVNRYF